MGREDKRKEEDEKKEECKEKGRKRFRIAAVSALIR